MGFTFMEFKFLILLAGLFAKVGRSRRKQEVFLCDHCGSECDIEDRIFDNCCRVCTSSLGYDRSIYWSDSDTLTAIRIR